MCYWIFAEETTVRLTRNNITGIHGILVFDESEAVHKLDLGDLAGAMSVEMALDISFGSYLVVSTHHHAPRTMTRRSELSTYHSSEDYPGTAW